MAFDQRGRGSGRPDDFADIEQMLRQLRSRFRMPQLVGLWILLGTVLVIWLATGFYTVAPDELGVVLRFGRVARVTEPGPHMLLPWPVETVLKTNVTEIKRIEVGFRTVPGQSGQAPQYDDVPSEAQMLTGDENIVSLEFIAQYQVKQRPDGGYAISDYLFNMKPAREADGRPVGSVEEGRRALVKEIAEAAMREVVGRHTIDSVLTEGKQQVQEQCKLLMQQILDGYRAGIDVTAVQLQDVQPPTDEVRQAFKDVASAREDRVRAIQQAEGERNDVIPKARGEAGAIRAAAEGYAQTRVADATGQASRFLSILEEYRQAASVTRQRIYLETMEEILAGSEKIVVDSQSADQLVPYLPLRGEVPRARQSNQR